MEKKERRKMVAALSFDPMKDSAPQVLAKGVGLVAENILKKAGENHIPVYEDEQLVARLNNIEVGSSIPPEMYEVVAEVLVFIADMDRKKGV